MQHKRNKADVQWTAGMCSTWQWYQFTKCPTFILKHQPPVALDAVMQDAGGVMIPDDTLRRIGFENKGKGTWSIPQIKQTEWKNTLKLVSFVASLCTPQPLA